MRSKNVFWGVILVTIGALFILRNMGVIYFGWYSILNLWPVLLVVLGISLLPIKSVMRILLAFIVIALSLVFISNSDYYDNNSNWFWDQDTFRYDDDWDNNDYFNDEEAEDYSWRDQELFETYDDDIKNAVLELEAVAGKFTLTETSKYLLLFEREGNFGKYYLRSDNAGSAVILKLNMDSYINQGSDLRNEAQISLHPDPIWDLKIDAGAAKLDLDLTPFKIDRIDIDGGASDIDIKLGDNYKNTDVSIDSGAASVTIQVPKDVACEVLTNTVLSSKVLDGFDKIERGVYRSDNYTEASNSITISIDAAISSLKVVRY